MAKYSISKVLESKRKVRILTILTCLVVIVLVANVLVTKNPKSSKASQIWIFNSGTLINNRYCNTSTGFCTNIAENDDVVIQGSNPGQVIVTMSGTNRFNSLVIERYATVTHDQVVAEGDDYADIIGAESSKKVDIVLAGRLVMQDGGLIDVSGKGFSSSGTYPEPSNMPMKNNGPGGGYGAWATDENNVPGGGGGYGGRGGPGRPVGAAPDNGRGAVSASDPPIRAGSAGGNARERNSGDWGRGGAGGGRVHITAKSVTLDSGSYIYANGQAGGNDKHAHGGGGSGGSLWIQLTSDDVSNVTAQALGSTYFGGETSDVIYKSYTVTTNTTFNLSASGGSGGGYAEWAGGGGGRVLIERIRSSDVTINKVLQPYSRGGVLYDITKPETFFNPYALQSGDEIRVVLNVSQLNSIGTVLIKDDILRAGSAGCIPEAGAGGLGGSIRIVSGATAVTNPLYDSTLRQVIWDIRPSSNITIPAVLEYICTVIVP